MAPPAKSTNAKVLILAASELSGQGIVRELRERGIDGESDVKVVAPVLASSRFEERVGSMDEERGEAEGRLQGSLRCLEVGGFHAEGWVGDSDPVLALEDALAEFSFETVIVATHRDSRQAFAEENLAPHAAGRLETDIVHLVLDPEEEEPLREVEEVEAAPLVERRMDRRARRTRRDLLAVGIGGLGTAILGILLFASAGLRNGHPQGVIQALLAASAFFLTFWGGAQVLFGEAVNRRGGATGKVADTLLVGVPVAVVLSAILAIV